MGAAAKVTLLLAMVAIVLGAQLLERELSARRARVQADRKAGVAPLPGRSGLPLAALTSPLDDAGLPACPAGAPGELAPTGMPGASDDGATATLPASAP